VEFSHQAGRTVFLCTHYLPEAQRLCDRVAVVNRGRLLATGTITELARTLWRGTWVDIECLAVSNAPASALIDTVQALPGVTAVRREQPDGTEKGTCFAVQVDGDQYIPTVVTALVERGGQVLRVNPRERTLEEVYFALQGESAGESAHEPSPVRG
jgi:ABC-2 type transport system ATP-binding protein